jgi:hypothetical protein
MRSRANLPIFIAYVLLGRRWVVSSYLAATG